MNATTTRTGRAKVAAQHGSALWGDGKKPPTAMQDVIRCTAGQWHKLVAARTPELSPMGNDSFWPSHCGAFASQMHLRAIAGNATDRDRQPPLPEP